jgi:hypothetical protein
MGKANNRFEFELEKHNLGAFGKAQKRQALPVECPGTVSCRIWPFSAGIEP